MEHIEELAKEKIIDDSARPNDEHEKLAKEPAEIIDDSLRREAQSMQAQFLNAARKSVPSAVVAATILGRTGQWVLSRISFGGADESTKPQAAVAEDYTLDVKILGEGIWGTVYHGSRQHAGELEQVAIKKLDKKDKEGKEKQDASTQLAEMEKECRLNRFAHELSKPSMSSLGCARVPRVHSYTGGEAIMQFVQGEMLEKYIRGPGYDEKPKRLRSIEDVAFAAHLRSVCHVVVQKICKLLLLGRDSEFSHRDLNDGNVMIDVKDTARDAVVKDPEDIAVWMIDFGKSMALIDGEQVTAGMKGAYQYNPTTDIVRLLMNIQCSYIKAYYKDAKEMEVPQGEVRDFLIEYMPFRAPMEKFVAHIKEIAPKDPDWAAIQETKPKEWPKPDLDFLELARTTPLELLRHYYMSPHQLAELMPEKILESLR